MGASYTVILQDDFDWKYVNSNKNDKIEKIKEDFRKQFLFYPEVLAQWYGHIVLDCGKSVIFLDKYKNIILNNCDSAIYWSDELPSKKEKLE